MSGAYPNQYSSFIYTRIKQTKHITKYEVPIRSYGRKKKSLAAMLTQGNFNVLVPFQSAFLNVMLPMFPNPKIVQSCKLGSKTG
jgi:hypothetical protein